MYTDKMISEQKPEYPSGIGFSSVYHSDIPLFRQVKRVQAAAFAAARSRLTLTEGLAVGALVHSGI